MAVHLLIVIIVVLLASLLLLYRHYRRTIRKVAFTFDALDNHDFTFRFSEDRGRDTDRMLHRALNRIRGIMEQYHQEAVEREQYYEVILNAMDAGVVVVDDKGNILQHNQAALRLMDRLALTHLVQISDRLKPDHFSIRETQAVLRGRQVRIIAFSDISGELNNEEVDAWVKLTRVLTHEIMNTITPVISITDKLLDERPADEGLTTIRATSQDLLHFVQSYRQFTHVPKPNPELFYVKPFLERTAALCGQPVAIDVEPRDLLLMADESLISHVVGNLLKNAVEAVGNDALQHADQPLLSLQAYTGTDDCVIIDVTDCGPLIPDDVAQHVFIPFFTTKATGSGIGLSLSKQIMRVSGGSITLVQDPAHGLVTFRLVFP